MTADTEHVVQSIRAAMVEIRPPSPRRVLAASSTTLAQISLAQVLVRVSNAAAEARRK